MLRLMLVASAQRNLPPLKSAVCEAGYDVVAEISSAMLLPAAVAQAKPDVIIIETDSPTRDLIDQICVLTSDKPHPIVMFTSDPDTRHIQTAIKAGVTAYIVAGMQPERIRPIVDVALARFAQDMALRKELSDAQSRLAERKLIEKAKGLLMTQKRCSEDEAFRSLRKLAMDRNLRLLDVARQVIDVSKLLN